MGEEKRFEIQVKKWLKEHNAWFVKTWSNGTQRAGLPDLIICWKGRFIGIELKDLKKRIGAAGADLSITARAKNFITDVGFDPDYGARPLKRAIRKYIEDPVAEFIIEMKGRKQTSGKLHISVGLSKDGTNTTVTCK